MAIFKRLLKLVKGVEISHWLKTKAEEKKAAPNEVKKWLPKLKKWLTQVLSLAIIVILVNNYIYPLPLDVAISCSYLARKLTEKILNAYLDRKLLNFQKKFAEAKLLKAEKEKQTQHFVLRILVMVAAFALVVAYLLVAIFCPGLDRLLKAKTFQKFSKQSEECIAEIMKILNFLLD